jgi:aminopeptidase N
MKTKHLLIPICAIAVIAACKTQQSATNNTTAQQQKFANVSPFVRPDYHPTANRLIDVIHTSLDVTPDWKKRYLYGKATITAKPYFYPTSVVELDARGMEIKSVRWADSGMVHDANPMVIEERDRWKYENDVITLNLGRTFSRNQEITIYIDYIAKPNELKNGGGVAITDDKGLYFIDPDDTDPTIPRQFWTQGETQASSAWFPCIDRPNEKMTSEIFMHVDPNLVTLSNGLLVDTKTDADGLKVDHWKMDQPHSPYLVMMAAGDFKVVKDTWRGKEVSYYVEPQFEKYGRSIFGKTPAMIEFFSNVLGVDYPWVKYSQICAREYVSGAMENTTATLHSDFLQLDDRELIDGSYEDYISHELFHQWFGDYVTAESWANLPLNESFATYGEYLWIEHAYGREWADMHSYESRGGYLQESGVPHKDEEDPGKMEPLIRFNYESQDDMFDGHSYNKGGQVLHMLRLEVGDEAFFASLKLYLESNKYQAAEIHDLRLAFEKTTGRDLNWFFDQWFMSPGHPELDITYKWDSNLKREMVIMKQVQDFTRGIPVYRLPMNVDVWVNGKPKREQIVCDSKCDTFYFDCTAQPDLVNVDPDKPTLAWNQDHHTQAEWAYMYRHASGYYDRAQAIEALSPEEAKTPIAKTIIAEAIHDHNYSIRIQSLFKTTLIIDSLKTEIKNLAMNDSSAIVRSNAVYMLAIGSDSVMALDVARKMLGDSSYGVFTASLYVVTRYSRQEGMKLCASYETAQHRRMKLAVAYAYMDFGSDEQQPWFEKTLFTLYGRSQTNFIFAYSQFLTRCKSSTVEKSLDGLDRLHATSFSRGTKFYCTIVMRQLEFHYKELAADYGDTIEKLGGPKKSNPRIDRLKEEKAEAERMATVLEQRRKKLKGDN